MRKDTPIIALLTLAGLCVASQWTEDELAHYRQERQQWEHNAIGEGQGKVMPPWTPMEIAGQMVRMLLWDYHYGSTLLPTQMLHQGEGILADTPWFSLLEGNREIIFKDATIDLKCISEEMVQVNASTTQDGVSLTLYTEIEFDGMMKLRLELQAPPNRQFNALRLVIPLQAKTSEFYHYYIAGHHPIRPFNQSGRTPAQGFALDELRHLVWLGNPRRGLCFFTEGLANWPLQNEAAIERISEIHDGTREFSVTFANRPFSISKPLAITFGLQATPTKTRGCDFRRQSDFSTLTWCWQNWADGRAHPFDDSPKARQYIEACRAKGQELMPYSSTHYYGLYRFGANQFGSLDHGGLIHPEIKLWGQEWQKKPLKDKRLLRTLQPLSNGRRELDVTDSKLDEAAGQDWRQEKFKPTTLIEVCPNSGFQDYYLWRLNRTVQSTGLKAIYLDSGVNSCANPAHGCGYTDYTGKWRESAPVFAARRMIKRMRRIFQEKFGETRICLHTSCHLEIPFLSLADSHLGAEQYAYEPFSVHEFYGELLDSDIMLAEHLGIPLGVAEEFLPVFNFFWRDYRAPSPASIRDLCGLCFVHDLNPSPKDTRFNDLIRYFQKLRLAFFPECAQVAYYWEDHGIFTVSPTHVKAILHWSSTQGLVVLYNWSAQITEARFTLQANRIFGDAARPFSLVDLVSKESFQSKDGTVNIPLAPRDFRMFRVQP